MDQDKGPSPEEQHQPQFIPQAITGPNGGSTDAHEQETDSQDPRFWRRWATVERLQAIFNGLLVIVTAVQTTVSFWQWQITQSSLHLTQRAVESANIQAKAAQEANALTKDIQARAERPLVGLDHIDFVNYVPGMRMGAEVYMINAGRSPARITDQDIHIGIVEGDIPAEPPKTEQILPLPYKRHVLYKSQGIALPSQPLRSRVLFDDSLPAEVFNNLRSGIASFVVWGKISYIDRFENPYTVEFCGVYNSKLDDPPTPVSPLVWCSSGSSIP